MDDDEADSDVFSLPPGDRSLAGAVMEGCDLMFARLAYVDLSGADLYWGSLQSCVLEGAILRDCILRGAAMKEANLRGVDLRGADLSLDNLGGATRLERADLTGRSARREDRRRPVHPRDSHRRRPPRRPRAVAPCRPPHTL